MTVCKLPEKTLRLWQIRCAIISVIIIAASAFLCFASPLYLIIPAALIFIYCMISFWYLPIYFKSYKIKFHNNAIVINRGVIVRACHIMPFPRMVFAESFATPLAKAMKLSCVMLKAARGVLLIPEMSEEDAAELIISLTRRISDEQNL